ncbi:MAG: GtrA family protein [Propionibacteriales bacterium]|nr:GtrA family protein [Propionibacteriales bacterium]
MTGRAARHSRLRALLVEVLRFLAVGGVAYVVDVGLTNLLVYGFGQGGPMADQPLPATVVSTAASMVVAWLGNKLWTYGHRGTRTTVRAVLLFVVVNLLSMLLRLVPLAVAWYLLGLRDPLSYNISNNIIGMALAMAFRFFAYRRFVFIENDTRARTGGSGS